MHSAKTYDVDQKEKRVIFWVNIIFLSPRFLSVLNLCWLANIMSTNDWSTLMYNSYNQSLAILHNFESYVLCVQMDSLSYQDFLQCGLLYYHNLKH